MATGIASGLMGAKSLFSVFPQFPLYIRLPFYKAKGSVPLVSVAWLPLPSSFAGRSLLPELSLPLGIKQYSLWRLSAVLWDATLCLTGSCLWCACMWPLFPEVCLSGCTVPISLRARPIFLSPVTWVSLVSREPRFLRR